MKQIENVIVDNGIEKHKVQYHSSDIKIITMVNRSLFYVTEEFINKLNNKDITVLIKCDADYYQAISTTLISSDLDLIKEFKTMA